ncbi:hypothetical protein HGRIS_010131 [Hohenbuehelia grisea]|uniref:Enoyl reductase (ER) domain-containing protein n=1 Tax=Hohenbuehelia grisea TaxID=104357 RepID=A0ABR3J3C3_9AGAR
MNTVVNGRVIYKAIPHGYPEPGKTVVYDATQAVDLDGVPLGGGILVKTLVLAISPYMRGKMRPAHIKSYTPPYDLNEPLYGYGVGVVLRSEDPGFKKGDHVFTENLRHEEYTVIQNPNDCEIVFNDVGLPWPIYVTAAGMPGMTAYMGWKEFSHAKKGDVVFVTIGAGAVGRQVPHAIDLVIQLAKLDGLEVISSAGSDAKVEYIRSLGADVAFNHKTTDTASILAEHGPINIFWDGVGGDTLDAALKAADFGARFIECGMISGYNGGFIPIKNIHMVMTKSISMTGFQVINLIPNHLANFRHEFPDLLAKGALKFRVQIMEGLDQVGEALMAVQKGLNTAPVVVRVAQE